MGERLNTDASDNKPKEHYYGESKKYDPTFDGPTSNRSCTDIICCFVFVLFIVGLGVVSAIGFQRGNKEIYILVTDYLGQVCGMSESVVDKPYLFFFDYLVCLNEVKPPKLDCTTSLQVCVDECPKENYAIEVRYSKKLDDPNVDVNSIDWNDFICIYGLNAKDEVNKSDATIKDLLNDNKCANFYTKSDVFTSRCYPKFLVSDTLSEKNTTPNNRQITEEDRAVAYDLLNLLQSYERFNNTVEEFIETWPYMVAGITISMFASLLYIVLMRWIAAIMVWSSIVWVFALLGYGTYFCWNERNCIKNHESDCTSDRSSLDYNQLASYLKMERIWYISAIIMSTILAILILVVLLLIKSIRIAIALIQEASTAVSSLHFSLLWPVIPFIMQLAFLTFWAFSVIFIASIVEPPYQIVNSDSTDEYTDGASCNPTVSLNGTAKCVLIGYNIVPNYIYWLEAYNLVALFWILNFIRALGQITLAGAFASYYWAFTKPDDIKHLPLLRSFWRSIRYHIGSIAFGSLIISIIKLIRFTIQYIEDKVRNADNCFTKFIALCFKFIFWCLDAMQYSFFDVYDMAIDTLFLCFLEDLERHDGTPEKPFYMSKQLMHILGVKKQKENEWMLSLTLHHCLELFSVLLTAIPN
ncbi:choline transporter-like protein 5-B [Anneissia japonica]|uniref:choline transporter-like protein 5-B n=1 Tax=Anneissia japonica TaxID=1529436 RepID=UPI0014259BBF|nr:choline transporter-like protein 5-B [Anneissia japonica]